MIYVSGAVCEGSSEARYEELKKETQKKKRKITQKRTEQSYILLLYYWKIIFNLQLNDHVCCSPRKDAVIEEISSIKKKHKIPFVLTSIIDLTLILV